MWPCSVGAGPVNFPTVVSSLGSRKEERWNSTGQGLLADRRQIETATSKSTNEGKKLVAGHSEPGQSTTDGQSEYVEDRQRIGAGCSASASLHHYQSP